jgi:hypothetical protein
MLKNLANNNFGLFKFADDIDIISIIVLFIILNDFRQVEPDVLSCEVLSIVWVIADNASVQQ